MCTQNRRLVICHDQDVVTEMDAALPEEPPDQLKRRQMTLSLDADGHHVGNLWCVKGQGTRIISRTIDNGFILSAAAGKQSSNETNGISNAKTGVTEASAKAEETYLEFDGLQRHQADLQLHADIWWTLGARVVQVQQVPVQREMLEGRRDVLVGRIDIEDVPDHHQRSTVGELAEDEVMDALLGNLHDTQETRNHTLLCYFIQHPAIHEPHEQHRLIGKQQSSKKHKA